MAKSRHGAHLKQYENMYIIPPFMKFILSPHLMKKYNYSTQAQVPDVIHRSFSRNRKYSTYRTQGENHCNLIFFLAGLTHQPDFMPESQ